MSDLPTTQSSWYQIARGSYKDVLKLKKDAPVPKPGKGEVLIKVHSVGLNAISYKVMPLSPWPVIKLPLIPHIEMAGTIVDANGDDSWVVGQDVMGTTGPVILDGKGVLAEYIVFPANRLVAKPSTMSWETAAGLTCVGLTAYQLLKATKLEKGGRLFINGGSSTVGILAIQLAKKVYGASFVAVSCSGRNEELVRSYGADEVYDYTKSPLVFQLTTSTTTPFDAIIDTVGSAQLFTSSTSYLKADGQFLSISQDIAGKGFLVGAGSVINYLWQTGGRPTWLGGTARKYAFHDGSWKEQDVLDLIRTMEEYDIKLPFDSVHGFDESGVMAASDRLMSYRARGKVIIAIVA